MVLPYFYWRTNLKSVRKKVKATHQHYVDISDEGAARFSKRAAEDFLNVLIRTFVEQDFSVPPLRDSYKRWKANQAGFDEIGFFRGEMVGNFETFRTRADSDANRRGWAVGIASRNAEAAFLAQKLSWLEFGTDKKGGSWKAGPQVPRPIVAQALEKFLGDDLPDAIRLMIDLSHIWGKGKR